MLGSGPDPQWERGIPWHWPCGVGGEMNMQSPLRGYLKDEG